MDMNSFSTRSRNDRAVPSISQRIAQRLHILLVVHNVASLMFLASRFEKQQYQVTTAESASGALDIMKKGDSNFDIVIADFDMPGMAIYEFVREVHLQSIRIPVILIAEDLTMELAREAMGNGVCFLFSKPLSDSDIKYTWHHVCRETGELPALSDINSCGGAAINRNLRNMKRKMMNSDEENNTGEDVSCNPKKSRMTWTASPQSKFLQPTNILGQNRAHPNSILGMIKDPGLTNIQAPSHLQICGKRRRLNLNPQETALPVVPAVLPTVPLGNCKKEQTSDTPTNYMAKQGAFQIPRSTIQLNAPKFAGYTIEYVKKQLDALNYSGNNTTKAISNKGSVQVGEGTAGVQIAQYIDPKHESNANGNESAHMTNAFQALLTKGLQDPNEEPEGDFKMGLGFGNAGNLANMSHANF